MKNWINKEIIEAVLRHVITAIGGVLIAKGILDAGQSAQLGSWLTSQQTQGAALILAAVVKSIFQKQVQAKALSAAYTDPAGTQAEAKAVAAAPPASPAPSRLGISAPHGIAVLALGLFLAVRGEAQTTNAPPLPPKISVTNLVSIGVTTNEVKVANDLLSYLEPLIPYLTNKTVCLDVAPLYSAGSFGFLADLQVPINQTLSLGGGAMLDQHQWFATLLSTKIGTSYKIPVINRTAYFFAEEGAALPLNTARIDSQTVVGAFTTFDLNPSLKLNLEGGAIKESSLPGAAYFFGASASWHFN